MRASLRRRSIVASRRGTTASIPARNGPNDPDVSSRGSGRLNDGRMTTGSSPARKVDDASARDVEARRAPRIKKARALRGYDSQRRRCLSTTSADDDDDGGGGGGSGGGGGRGSGSGGGGGTTAAAEMTVAEKTVAAVTV